MKTKLKREVITRLWEYSVLLYHFVRLCKSQRLPKNDIHSLTLKRRRVRQLIKELERS